MSEHDGAVPEESPEALPDGTIHGAPDGTAGGEGRRRRLVALLDDGAAVSGDGEGSHGAQDLPWLRDRLARLCLVTVTEIAVDGAGVTVMGSTTAGLAGRRDQLAATGRLTRRLEDLQLTAGEGPCLDAYDGGAPVLAEDIATETIRWLGFAPEAIVAGAAAVFSLPLQVGAIRLGTLDLHRRTTGPLSPDQLADALALAALATEILLELAVAPDPDDGDGSVAQSWGAVGWLPDVHADVHVASGMLSAQAGIDVGAALLRIRAYAFARSEPIHDVARRVIDRDLRLQEPGDDNRSPPHDPENTP